MLNRRSLFLTAIGIVLSVKSAFGAPVVVKHSVSKIKQPSTMSCWAAAATMLKNWRSGFDRSIDEVVAIAGSRFTQIYQASFDNPPQGIFPVDEEEFYSKVGLIVLKGLNPSIDKWGELLRDKGPLSVTVDADPGKGYIHALVVTGLDGDGTSGGTILTYIDPADGLSHDLWFGEFLKLYEGSASWPLQIMHNP